MTNETTGGHLVEEAGENGATPYYGGTIRWPLPEELVGKFAYVEYPADIDLPFAMQRTANIIAAMQRVREQLNVPQTPQNAPQQPRQVQPRGDVMLSNPPQPTHPQQQRRGGGRQPHPEDNVFTCPEHGVPLLKTAAQYDNTGDKFYHPLPQEEWYLNERGMTVKNCNMWRSAVVSSAAGGA